MKVRYIGILLIAILTFFSCDDSTGTLGIGMLPDSDKLSVHTTTFEIETRSFVADSVFAKTNRGYVGKFTDPEFGYYEASFLTELNCTNNYLFPEVYSYDEATGTGKGRLAGDTVVSANLVVFYNEFFGDSLNACRMSVYELDRKLDKNRYTNIDPEQYYSKYNVPSSHLLNTEPLLGRKAYSAYDASVPDSIRNATDSYGNKTFTPYVSFPLSKEFGAKLLRLNREYAAGKNDYFDNSDKFIDNVFKGVYVKSDYGDGTILYVDHVALQMQFRFHYLNDSTGVALKKADGTDSLYYGSSTVLASTKEVIQANQFLNSERLKEKANERNHTYIKSPAGIFTEATLPYDAIHQALAQDTLNAVTLTFTNYNQESKYEFSMSTPDNVLLIRKQELESFFEDNDLPDNVTSYTVSHNNVATNQYTFRNIARLVTTCINEKQAAKRKAREEAGASWNEAAWEAEWNATDWDKVLLIPVTITYESETSTNMIGLQNDLKPGYAKLKGGPDGEKLQLEVTYTSFNK